MFGRLSASRGAIAAALVAVMLAVVALMPGSFSPALAQTAGTPPPPAPAVVTVTVVVDGNTETIVTTPGGLATVVLPPGSAVTAISLTVTTSPAEASDSVSQATQAVTSFVSDVLGGTVEGFTGGLTGLSGSKVVLGYVFEVSFGGSASYAGQMFVMGAGAMLQLPQHSLLQTGIELPQPATGILNVLPETLAQAGGDLSRLAVYFVDPDNGILEPVKMLPSPAPGQVAFEFTKPGAYAVLVSVITVDATVAPAPANTGIAETTRGGPHRGLRAPCGYRACDTRPRWPRPTLRPPPRLAHEATRYNEGAAAGPPLHLSLDPGSGDRRGSRGPGQRLRSKRALVAQGISSGLLMSGPQERPLSTPR